MVEHSNKRIALVTGANKGIGYETALRLASQGIAVLIGARDEQRGKEAAAKLQAEGLDVQFLRLDVNDQTTHKAARSFIEDKFGNRGILNVLCPRREELIASLAPAHWILQGMERGEKRLRGIEHDPVKQNDCGNA